MTSSPEPILKALDALDIKYRRHVNEQGHAYAGFRLVFTPSTELQFGIIRWGPSIVVRAHDVVHFDQISVVHLRDFNELNYNWAVGRIYYNVERKGLDIATGIYFDSEDGLDPTHLSTAIDSLCRVAGHLRAEPQIRASNKSRLLDELWAPYRQHDISLLEILSLLEDAGLYFETRGNNELLVQRFYSNGRSDFLVDIYGVAKRFIYFRGRLDDTATLPLTRESFINLQKINQKLSLGVAVLKQNTGQPFFLLPFPMDWRYPEPNLLKTAVEHVADATQSIERNLVKK